MLISTLPLTAVKPEYCYRVSFSGSSELIKTPQYSLSAFQYQLVTWARIGMTMASTWFAQRKVIYLLSRKTPIQKPLSCSRVIARRMTNRAVH
jgi:hypothetical protein